MAKAQSNFSPDDKDPLAQLIRNAGRRPPIPPGREQRVHAAVKAEWRRVVRQRRKRLALIFVPSGLVAAAIAFALISHVVHTTVGTPATVASVEFLDGSVNAHAADPAHAVKLGETITSGTTLETGATSRAALRLADGQSLRLDINTRARFDKTSIYLEAGALYVDTALQNAAKPKQPVDIQTEFGEVHDIGTQFEVRLSDAARPLAVRVREGRVDLKRGNDKASVAAGEEISAAATGQFVARKISVSDPLWNWASSCAPAVHMDGNTLDHVLSWVCREQGWTLAYDTEAVKSAAQKAVLHGSLDGIPPRQALDVVVPASGMSYTLDGTTLHIK